LYKINPKIDVPIYTQLVDMIKADIVGGVIPYGSKLPTVRELSEECGVAPGTVMRVYDQLEQLGLAEKKQGKGTFACYRRADEGSRKEKAMAAIDVMLDTMGELEFSESETSIFLNLKLRERASDLKGVQIAVVECNNEALYQISEQLRGVGEVSVYPYHLDEIRAYPYSIPEDMDLIVVSAPHAQELTELLPVGAKTVKAVLSLTPASFIRIARIAAGSRVGVLSQSSRFGDLLAESCRSIAENVSVASPALFSSDIAAYLKSISVLLLPMDYERFCSEEDAGKIKAFAADHSVIQCGYRIDEGSMMYIEDRIKKLRR